MGNEADEESALRAKALSGATRVAILGHLRSAPDPLTPHELASALGLHHTAVRPHLSLLCEAGFAETVRLPPAGRGRPRIAYRAVEHPDPYEHLAGLLAVAVGEGVTPYEAGRRVALAAEPHPDGVIAAINAAAERAGFRPRDRARAADTHEVVLQHCPFAAVAQTSPDVVCELHRGLVQGLTDLQPEWRLVDLKIADPRRAGCRVVLRRAAPPT